MKVKLSRGEGLPTPETGRSHKQKSRDQTEICDQAWWNLADFVPTGVPLLNPWDGSDER
jgi:hypothetical protein